MLQSDVVILGAGASGLCCALVAARRGRGVLVLDHGPVAARKLRISGGGRCNFTHLDARPDRYLSDNPHFTKSALSRFSPWDAVSLFAELGLGYEEKNPGQLFCAQGAPALARALEDACTAAGARLQLRTRILGAERYGEGFLARTNQGDFACRSLVIALGGPSWPTAGATDLGFSLAKSFGLRIVPPRPALAPFVLDAPGQKLCATLAGVSLRARLQSGQTAVEDDLLFTHKGISGPAALQLSLHWERGREIVADLLPGLDLAAHLRSERRSKTQLKNHLSSLLPGRIPAALLPSGLAGKPLCDLSNADIDAAAERLLALRLRPTRTEGLGKAEVTAGGVDTCQISSKTMQCDALPGLFVIGEALDVTGQLGGYNLHWAWASAHAAGQFI
ncbi:BaiN/RdsA family NAD(P)/FAD-dependent oxidoreductase [Paucidesulfovibrio longus]|uniref:NAD(P)/FAD-dependent oxidoreductase n=1 Tax=Paucidesulfovibrio longus TaxID=889 RepID=UPI0003B778B4|nr:aminoacetone oxidase family FAD-binding enzyme [Paucidesulfovibrio longus]